MNPIKPLWTAVALATMVGCAQAPSPASSLDPLAASGAVSEPAAVSPAASRAPASVRPGPRFVVTNDQGWSAVLPGGEPIAATPSPAGPVMTSTVWTVRRAGVNTPVGAVARSPSGRMTGVVYGATRVWNVSGTLEAPAFTPLDMVDETTATTAQARPMDDAQAPSRPMPLLLGADAAVRRPSDPLPTASRTTASVDSTKAAKVKSVASPGLDLVLGYSPEFAAAWGGLEGANNRLVVLVELANQAFESSQANTRLDLISTLEVSAPVALANSQALDDLSSYQATAARAYAVPLLAERARWGADLVGLVRPYSIYSGSCGVGYINGGNGADMAWYTETALFIANDGSTSNGQSCDPLSLAHEVGHVLGQAHDRANASNYPTSAHDPFGYGVQGQGPQGKFSDVMGYPAPGAVRLPLFSNPRLNTCKGTVCGIVNESDTAASLAGVVSATTAWGSRDGGVRLVPASDGWLELDLPSDVATLTSTATAPIVITSVYGPANDPTAVDPFDAVTPNAGSTAASVVLPANPASTAVWVEVRLAVAAPSGVGRFKVWAGVGDRGTSNVGCASDVTTAPTCSWWVLRPAQAPTDRAWVVVQGVSDVPAAGQYMVLESAVLSDTAGVDTVVFGPSANDPNRGRLFYQAPSMAVGDARAVAVYGFNAQGEKVMERTVRLQRIAGAPEPLALRVGEQADTALGAGRSLDVWVPVYDGGELRLEVHAEAGAGALYLDPPQGGFGGRVTLSETSPGRYLAVFRSGARWPGRWALRSTSNSLVGVGVSWVSIASLTRPPYRPAKG